MGPDETIGVTVGSYKVTAKLGQGGMGAVYLAEHPLLERKAAVKVLLPELSSHTDLVERFFHEARMTARLRHPAMVDVYDFGTLADGRAYLIMDFLEGENLETRLRERGALAPTQALRIARDIAVGVAVAHAEEIVHRDLKPDNIFLLPALAGTQDERVKILDFGIAKLGSKPGESRVGVTRVGALLGTPLYMSPEQCRGAGEVDARADIYSLGCILFAMLAGRPPFVSDSMGELLGMQLMAPPPTLESLGVAVPTPVEALVQSMLAKAPEDRPPTMVAAAEAMDRLLHEMASGSTRNARTLAFGARDREVNTRRGRPTADPLHAAAGPATTLTQSDRSTPTTTENMPVVGAGTSPGTLAGRSISEPGRLTPVNPRRKTLLVAGAALAVLVVGGLLALGLRGPAGQRQVAVPAPPASSSVGTSAGAAPAGPRPSATTGTGLGGLGTGKTEGSGASVATPSTAGIAPAAGKALQQEPLAQEPLSPTTSGPATGEAEPAVRPGASTHETGRETGRKDGQRKTAGAAARARVVPSGKAESAATAAKSPSGPAQTTTTPPTPAKPGRPIYRGTQLQIEKDDPY